MATSQPTPVFDLWTEPWITLERSDGTRERLGIEQTLLRAHEYRSLYEPSPLIVVGIHRLLAAILQAAIDPRKPSDLRRLWQQGQFPAQAVTGFATAYGHRFDLFSPTAPFLQSADLALYPSKGDKTKTVAYLTPEIPAITEIAHYRHGRGDEQAYCPACAAGGLVTTCAFATSGGAGIKPSINGVPPIYILPGGDSLFQSLVASLILPPYQPEVAWREGDAPWWARPPLVQRSQEVVRVGYLHSLTFTARRVRLHPEPLKEACTRCGLLSEWGVRTMVFEMGESRPKDAPFWFDPFAAYRLPTKGRAAPAPIRPDKGKATWREFASLFLHDPSPAGNQPTRRPRVLDQMADLGLGAEAAIYPFRCIGLRTDTRAKVFEWIDAGFDVPPALLADDYAGLVVGRAIQFATDCARIISGAFDGAFGGTSKKQKRCQGLKVAMESGYWTNLAGPFRDFVLALAGRSVAERDAEFFHWLDVVVREARQAFERAATAVGDNGATLRRRVEGEQRCRIRLASKRKEYLPHG